MRISEFEVIKGRERGALRVDTTNSDFKRPI